MNLADLTSPQTGALDRNMPVIIPVAALEQHGRHLPLFTDSLLAGEIVRRVAERYDRRILVAPLIWLGNSDHHLDFAGTVSVRPRVYLDLLAGVANDFMRHGFRRIIFLNGHGGNDVPGRQVVFEMRQQHRQSSNLLLVFATYWMLGGQPGQAIAGLAQNQMGHACEWETSMMLRLHPELVGAWRDLAPVESVGYFDPAARGWITTERTGPGHIGNPAAATAEKGEALFGFFKDEVGGLIEKILSWDGQVF